MNICVILIVTIGDRREQLLATRGSDLGGSDGKAGAGGGGAEVGARGRMDWSVFLICANHISIAAKEEFGKQFGFNLWQFDNLGEKWTKSAALQWYIAAKAICKTGWLAKTNVPWKWKFIPIEGWSLSGGENWWRIHTMRAAVKTRLLFRLQSQRFKLWSFWSTLIRTFKLIQTLALYVSSFKTYDKLVLGLFFWYQFRTMDPSAFNS